MVGVREDVPGGGLTEILVEIGAEEKIKTPIKAKFDLGSIWVIFLYLLAEANFFIAKFFYKIKEKKQDKKAEWRRKFEEGEIL